MRPAIERTGLERQRALGAFRGSLGHAGSQPDLAQCRPARREAGCVPNQLFGRRTGTGDVAGIQPGEDPVQLSAQLDVGHSAGPGTMTGRF